MPWQQEYCEYDKHAALDLTRRRVSIKRGRATCIARHHHVLPTGWAIYGYAGEHFPSARPGACIGRITLLTPTT